MALFIKIATRGAKLLGDHLLYFYCTKNTIRRKIGVNTWFNNKKLIKTHEYIEQVSEHIDIYRIRKIKWAIEEMLENDKEITAYKVQLYAGFGGSNKKVRGLIENVIDGYSYNMQSM